MSQLHACIAGHVQKLFGRCHVRFSLLGFGLHPEHTWIGLQPCHDVVVVVVDDVGVDVGVDVD